MRYRLSLVFTTLSLLIVPGLVGCGGSDSNSAGSEGDPSVPNQDPTSPDPTSPDPTGQSPTDPSDPIDLSECTEAPLFAPQSYGSNSDDLIRHVEYDATSGDVYFSILNDMYVLREDASTPELLGERPNDDIQGRFWLADDRILFPSGSLVPLVEGSLAVLYSTDRNMGDTEVVVGLPVPESDNYRYEAGAVFVVGDEVFWLGRDYYTDNPARIPPEWQTTYVLRRSSWRSPGEPEDLYSTTRFVRKVALAGGMAFLEEQISDEGFGEWEQTIVDLASGAVDDETALEKFNGTVVAGGDDSVFVSRLDLDDIDNIGTFHATPDATNPERITSNSFVELFVERDGAWVFVDPQGINDPILVHEYREGQGVTLLGCIDGRNTTAHALTIAEERVLVAIFRPDTSVILSFDD